MKKYDVVIIGGGIVGMTTALLLAKETSLSIALIEQKPFSLEWNSEKYGDRTSAISLTSAKIFQEIHCFSAMKKKRFAPYFKMHVWSDKGEIQFNAKEVGKEYLGFMIEDQVMQATLFEKLKSTRIDIFSPCHLTELHQKLNHIELIYDDNEIIQTKLLIGADGANSWVRKKLDISFQTIDYEQTAIVFHVKTELPHDQTARQRFMKEGPLAFLPLDDPHVCSIVWSVKNDCVENLLQLSEDEFLEKLAEAFEYRLGKVTALLSTRKSFPLRMRHVNHYIKPNVALVGDAAHTIHPLAGQGVNLGILDALKLSEVVIQAYQKNREFFSYHTLRRYERARKSETTVMITMVDVLNRLFSNDVKWLQEFRNCGLNFTNKMHWMKKFLVEYAAGES